MKYMLVVPPEGDIEQIEFDADVNKAFETIQRRASLFLMEKAHVELVRFVKIDGVEMYVDEDMRLRAVELALNERASWLAQANVCGAVVVCGAGLTGLTLEKALDVIKMLDGAT